MLGWKPNPDPIVKRLRWVMLAAMLFSGLSTLLGQPNSFWLHPQTALRGDGLSIYSPTNRTFDFFLGHGWDAYIATILIYVVAAFLALSLLPKACATITALAAIFGHYFGATLWLGSVWHLGGLGFVLYAVVLGVVLAFWVFPSTHIDDRIVSRLRWLMSAAILLDFFVTLLGQPHTYWRHPGTVNEADPLFAFFLLRGWIAGVLFYLVYLVSTYLLVSIDSRNTALVCIFAMVFGHFSGASSWLFFRWRLGMQAPVLYGALLSTVIVLLAVPPGAWTTCLRRPGEPFRPVFLSPRLTAILECLQSSAATPPAPSGERWCPWNRPLR